MGQKVHPTSFRIGTIYTWKSQWFATKDYQALLAEDRAVRGAIQRGLAEAGISGVDIERNANQATVTIHTAKPGVVIGRGGQRVDEIRAELEKLTKRRIRVNIQEIRTPELDANLVARNVADQLERRVAFRRAIKQAVQRTMQRGAEGAKIIISGRLSGGEMSRRAVEMDGRVPLHTLRADIDYGFAEARIVFGRIGVKVWIYRGDILSHGEAREPEEETGPARAVAPPASSPVARQPDAPGGESA